MPRTSSAAHVALASAPSVLTPQVTELLAHAPGMYAGVVEGVQPHTARVVHAQVDPAPDVLRLVFPTASAGRFLALAVPGARLALVAAALHDYEAVQYKGTVLSAQPSSAADCDAVAATVAQFAELIAGIGMDAHRYNGQHAQGPYTTLLLAVDAVFDQTPRRGAGGQLGGTTQPQRPMMPAPLPQPSDAIVQPSGGQPTAQRRWSALPDAMRPAMTGLIPTCMTSATPYGEPNTTYITQVWYVDAQHLAISCQFFNKTTRNVRANPYVSVMTTCPETYAMWRVRARYVESQTEGPLFDEMADQLAVIASMAGMADVFALLSADVYAVDEVELVAPGSPSAVGPV